MGRKRRSIHEYQDMLKIVRKYAKGFDASSGYDGREVAHWGPGKKATLTRYFQEIHRLTFRPYTVYAPRKKSNLRPVQEFSQHTEGHPKLKVAFVPGVEKTEIRVTDEGQVISKDYRHGVTKKTVKFDKLAIVTDTENEIQRVLDRHPELTDFRIMAGNFEIGKVYSKRVVPGEIQKLMSRYNVEEANNYFGNWLHGIIGYQFETVGGFMDFNRQLIAAKQRIKEERAKLSRKVKRERAKRKYTR